MISFDPTFFTWGLSVGLFTVIVPYFLLYPFRAFKALVLDKSDMD